MAYFAAALELADGREWAADAIPLAESIEEDASGALEPDFERRGGMQAVAHDARSRRVRRPRGQGCDRDT